jgi:hypothetical protein
MSFPHYKYLKPLLLLPLLLCFCFLEKTHAVYSIQPFALSDLVDNDPSNFLSDLTYWSITNLKNPSIKYYICAGSYTMGGYGVTGPYPLYTRIYDGLGSHNSLSMSFTLYQLDSLDSQDGFGYDTVNVYIDDVFIPMWTQSQYQIVGPSTCGASDIDIILPIFITAPHSAPNVTVKFDAFFDQDSTDESYGFRDIYIALSTTSPALSATICGNSSLIPAENQCKCSAQQYYNQTTSSCVGCDGSCDTCTGSGPTYCIKCIGSYYMSAQGCIPRCSAGYYYSKDQNNCKPCNSDTYLPQDSKTNQCVPCPIGYSTNNTIAQSICNFCATGYYRSSDSSCKLIPTCNSGSYFDTLFSRSVSTKFQFTNYYLYSLFHRILYKRKQRTSHMFILRLWLL